MKWGAFLGLAVCVWTLIVHALGFYTTNIAAGQRADVAAIVLPVAAVILALLERRRRASGLTWPQSLATGAVIGVVSAAISAAFLWWYHHYMNPQWMDFIVAWKTRTMVAANASSGDIAKAVEQLRASATDKSQIGGAFIGSTLLCAVLASIIGVFLRRAPTPVRTAWMVP